MKSKRLVLITVFLVTILVLASTAWADEISNQIKEAIVLYEAGDYAGAASELDFAAAQIRQLQAGKYSDALPDPLPGWESEAAEITAVSGSMMGGAVGADREYRKDDATAEIQILAESPMLPAVAMMFNNQMMLTSSGMELIKIKGQKATLEYDTANRSGEIMLVVLNTVLVTVSGNSIDEAQLKAYAEAIDYALIKKIAAGS